MKNLKVIFFLFLVFLLSDYTIPCTIAVISGKATHDGRPLLWKNRDSDDIDNKIMFFNDGRYYYIGLVNSRDKEGTEVWIGMNNTGFAIMNSASYNLKLNDTTKLSDREGIIIKMALQQCATLEDFETMLNNLPKPWGLEANFGVIDAIGGAAFYETSNWNFKKFDANDINTAPDGYLLRTNFSFSGETDKGQGYERYSAEEALFQEAFKSGNISVRFIIQNASRSLKHGLTNADLTKEYSLIPNDSKLVSFADFIPRYSTSASVVIQGVKEPENPLNSIMWTVLGFPLCSVVYPVWLNQEGIIPGILSADNSEKAPLCSKVLEVKKNCFPVIRGRGTNYININALYNGEKTGIMQKLQPLENFIFSESERFIETEKDNLTDSGKLSVFYSLLDKRILEEYKKLFGI